MPVLGRTDTSEFSYDKNGVKGGGEDDGTAEPGFGPSAPPKESKADASKRKEASERDKYYGFSRYLARKLGLRGMLEEKVRGYEARPSQSKGTAEILKEANRQRRWRFVGMALVIGAAVLIFAGILCLDHFKRDLAANFGWEEPGTKDPATGETVGEVHRTGIDRLGSAILYAWSSTLGLVGESTFMVTQNRWLAFLTCLMQTIVILIVMLYFDGVFDPPTSASPPEQAEDGEEGEVGGGDDGATTTSSSPSTNGSAAAELGSPPPYHPSSPARSLPPTTPRRPIGAAARARARMDAAARVEAYRNRNSGRIRKRPKAFGASARV